MDAQRETDCFETRRYPVDKSVDVFSLVLLFGVVSTTESLCKESYQAVLNVQLLQQFRRGSLVSDIFYDLGQDAKDVRVTFEAVEVVDEALDKLFLLTQGSVD